MPFLYSCLNLTSHFSESQFTWLEDENDTINTGHIGFNIHGFYYEKEISTMRKKFLLGLGLKRGPYLVSVLADPWAHIHRQHTQSQTFPITIFPPYKTAHLGDWNLRKQCFKTKTSESFFSHSKSTKWLIYFTSLIWSLFTPFPLPSVIALTMCQPPLPMFVNLIFLTLEGRCYCYYY